MEQKPVSQTMRNYILEQGITMQQVIEHVPGEVEGVLQKIGRQYKRILLVGSGTSLNAAIAGKYVMEEYNDCEVQVVTPFDFIHYFPEKRITNDALVVGISQTARSTGVIDSIHRAREYGARTLFLTAAPQAAGAQCAESILNTWTGDEFVGPKTKGFTSTMAALFYLAAGLGGKSIDLTTIPGFISETIGSSEKVLPGFVDQFLAAPSLKIIGFGPNMAVAREGGLKALETIRIPVEVYDVEEYMHGPYHCLEKDTYMIFIAPPGKGQERILRLFQFADCITSNTLVIGDEDLASTGRIKNLVPLPCNVDEMLTPLGYIIPLQILANDITLKKGRRPELSRYPNFHAMMGSKFTPQ
ncbi:SIS domain-containing protein [Longilinea arvoryzae]|uniref:SIS domain-containing protein n=1 Tax=Longilinea arvoryzae TaxID=360412 RepID=UPI0009FA98E0|nr:SIS domain-containing protein [Longilinea arvoryzae]